MEITANLESLEGLQKRLASIKKKVKTLEGLEPVLGEVLRDNYKKVFESAPPTETGGDVYGGQYWKPLSESYLLNNPHRRSGKIHIDTANLMKSLTEKTHPLHISKVEGEEYVFGSSVEYLANVQKYRTVLFWHPEVLDRMTEAILEELKKLIENKETKIK